MLKEPVEVDVSAVKASGSAMGVGAGDDGWVEVVTAAEAFVSAPPVLLAVSSAIALLAGGEVGAAVVIVVDVSDVV